jgi:hypothetical protein
MELREFARRVLFATTLEENFSVRTKSWMNVPDQLVTLAAPGRPRELQFKPHDLAAEFPGLHHLEQQANAAGCCIFSPITNCSRRN